MSDDSLILIRARRAEIKAEHKRLDDEDAELDHAEKTIIRLASARHQNKPSPNGANPKTQKEYVLHALQTHRGGWYENVKDLRDAVAAIGKDIPMSSFQPLISDMVNTDKTLQREGSKVGLAPNAQGS
jgi:hypothetical protein